ncbi:MAG: cache domain-containing protein, partial [Chloroflexota bacterium]
MLHFLRRSLLRQLLGVYLIFVSAVLGTGLAVNFIVQDRLRSEVQSSDLALAQAIALETDDSLHDARDALRDMAAVPVVRNGDASGMLTAFRAFKAARKDVDRIYWLDANGIMGVSVPSDVRTENMSMAQSPIFQRARSAPPGSDPLLQAGLVDLTTFNAVVSIAFPVRDSSGQLKGVLATNLLLDDLSLPLRTVARDQQQRGHAIEISMIDDQGQLIGTLERERLLQPVVQDMPGAAEALAGHSATRLSPGPQSQNWLYTSAPVPNSGWAVVVQRPASDAMSVVDNFTAWLSAATFLFAVGGLLFWLVLIRRVINPLHLLARSHRSVGVSNLRPSGVEPLAARPDEIGEVARSLVRLERDVNTQLGELHTLLDTSTAVVSTLDPRTVAEAIIFEVGRLVDVQAASIRVPGDDGLLRVLASVGRGPGYEESEAVHPDDPHSPAALALRDGQAVQMVAGDGSGFPLISYEEGFRALLAIPIISPRVGQVVLLVHRVSPTPFIAQEIELLLTFTNYAALAWEHAVLYERSDERLQEVAQENER